MGPEMVQSQPMAQLLHNMKFTQKLGFIFIDEVHILLQWGSTFQKDYLKLGELQSCVRTHITFLAMSTSLHNSSHTKVQGILGFKKGHFHDEKLPIDQTDLMYCLRFLSHSTEGMTFPNLTWVIPEIVNTSSQLVPTLFTCRTIDKVINLSQWPIMEIQKILLWDVERNLQLAAWIV